jgi:hypothetical protein
MAFTRYSYDECRIQKDLEESTRIGNYHFNTPGNGVNLYFFDDPHIRMQKWGCNLSTNKTEIESDLKNLNIKNNRDNIEKNNYKKYLESNNLLNNNNYNLNNNSITNQSRSSHPAWEIRTNDSINQVNNFNYLFLDPQENTCFNFHNNISTRILEKDYYKYKNSM